MPISTYGSSTTNIDLCGNDISAVFAPTLSYTNSSILSSSVPIEVLIEMANWYQNHVKKTSEFNMQLDNNPALKEAWLQFQTVYALATSGDKN
jgi:hypothetical protein